MKLNDWRKKIEDSSFLDECNILYGPRAEANIPRYEKLLDLFEKNFGREGDIALFSAPGRTEIGGNHTDHQRGRVLAASVNMDTIAAVRITDQPYIRILSEGYPMCTVDLSDMNVHKEEVNSTAALIRGVAARFAQLGCSVRGFDAAAVSSVLPGSGISSSAAFEVLLGTIINRLFFNSKETAAQIAQIGQYAENVYFGKPSGLMDQMASSVGNILTIDFADKDQPAVRQLDVDFASFGLALCIIDSGADHADLTDEYAAIPNEMKKACAVFGREVLSEIPEDEFIARIPEVRAAAGDRAVLRAFHFYSDNERVPRQVKALECGDIDTFLHLVKESGCSSWMYLQNVIPAGYKEHQEMGVALALCDVLLKGRGAYRVHGGGFAGTVQAFVPEDMLNEFKTGIEKTLGEGSCHVLFIRPVGGTRIPE